jgi:hypothetical protein
MNEDYIGNEYVLQIYNEFISFLDKNKSLINTYNLTVDKELLYLLRQDEYGYEDQSFMTFSFKGDVNNRRSLSFKILFYSDAAVIEILNMPQITVFYSGIVSAKKFVSHIIITIKALLNKQLVVIQSNYKDKPYAKELLLIREIGDEPIVLCSSAKFPWLKQKGDSTSVLSNDLLNVRLVIPEDYFLYSKLPNGKWPVRGRKIQNLDVQPLSRKDLKQAAIKAIYETTPIAHDESPITYVFKTIEFYALFAVCIFIAFTYVPEDYHGIFFPITGAISFYFILPFILKRRMRKGKRPILERLFLKLPKWVRSRDYLFLFGVAFLASIPIPDSYLENSDIVTSYGSSAIEHPELWLPVILATIFTFIAIATNKNSHILIKLILMTLVGLSYFIFSIKYFNAKEQPDNLLVTISVLLSLGGFIAAISVLIYRIYKDRIINIRN